MRMMDILQLNPGMADLQGNEASGSVGQSQRPPVIAVLRNVHSDRRFISRERPAQDSKFRL
jgi:hypothetical protein